LLAECRRRRPSDSDDDPIDTAYKENEAAVEAKKVAEENLRKVSAQYKKERKLADHWENQAKLHLDSIASIYERNNILNSDIEACQAKENTQRSKIDTFTNTITEIRRERELLGSDYDSLQEELEDNEPKMNAARDQRENLQREYTNLLKTSINNQRLSDSNGVSLEQEIV